MSNEEKILSMLTKMQSDIDALRVDIETINIVNNNVIDAFSQSYEIAQRAITERQDAGKQLQTNEKNLKDAIIKYTGLN